MSNKDKHARTGIINSLFSAIKNDKKIKPMYQFQFIGTTI